MINPFDEILGFEPEIPEITPQGIEDAITSISRILTENGDIFDEDDIRQAVENCTPSHDFVGWLEVSIELEAEENGSPIYYSREFAFDESGSIHRF